MHFFGLNTRTGKSNVTGKQVFCFARCVFSRMLGEQDLPAAPLSLTVAVDGQCLGLLCWAWQKVDIERPKAFHRWTGHPSTCSEGGESVIIIGEILGGGKVIFRRAMPLHAPRGYGPGRWCPCISLRWSYWREVDKPSKIFGKCNWNCSFTTRFKNSMSEIFCIPRQLLNKCTSSIITYTWNLTESFLLHGLSAIHRT